MLELFFISLVVLLISWWFLVATRHPKDFPPGPRFTLPVIGNALAIGSDMNQGFQKLRKKYGDVVGFFLGPDRAVVVSDFNLLQELGASPVFADRQEFAISADIIRAGPVKSGDEMTVGGIIHSNGPTWVEQRRYALHTLRDLGFGRNSMEERIRDEVEQLYRHLEKKAGRAINIWNYFNTAVLNSLWAIITNEKLEYDNAKLLNIIASIDKTLKEFSSPINQIVMTYKPLIFIAKHTSIFSLKATIQSIRAILKEVIDQHQSTYQEDSMRDFVDYYLKEMNKKAASLEDSSFKGKDGMTNLMGTLIDLFIAGSETTSTTLNWAMLFMIQNPGIQQKVQEELDNVTGRGRLPAWMDRSVTPYTEAVIHEIQRCSNILPLSVFHATASSAYLGGYFIPKGTTVFMNLGHVMSDPKNFSNPEKFDPTRYLTSEGKFHPHPMVLPFGLGKRRCLGETLAKTSLYLFFTGLLSHFTVTKAREDDHLTTKAIPGIVESPTPYELKFIIRK